MYTPGPDNTFLERREAVIETAHHYELEPGNAVLIGGAAFALLGLDTRVNQIAIGTFDVDAHVSPDKFAELSYLPVHPTSFDRLPAKDNILPLDIWLNPRGWEECFFTNQATTVSTVEGIPVPDIDSLLRLKMIRIDSAQDNAVKDSVGLLQAHMIAEQEGMEVVKEPTWLEAMKKALYHAKIQAIRYEYVRESYPWIDAIQLPQ